MSFSISGLSGSGLDVAALVKGIMDAERIPYKSLELRKEKLGMEQQAFRQINTKLNTLNTALSDLKHSFNLQAYKATASSEAIKPTASESAVAGTYKIEVTQVAVNAAIKTTDTDFLDAVRNGTLKLGSGENEIDFGSAEVKNQLGIAATSDNEELLKKVVNYINANSQKIGSSISMIKDGSSYELQITSNSADPVKITDFTNYTDIAGTGTKAQFKVNGRSFERNSNDISDIIPGVSFTIGENVEINKAIILTVAADTDKIADKVQTFVNAYNDLITNVRTNLAKPEDVKKTMNPLQGDSVLKDINARLYDVFNDKTNFGFMEEIGLSIDKGAKTGSSMTGNITFDREAFKTALTENPTKATSILTSVSQEMSDTISRSWTSSVTGVMSIKIAGYDADIKRTDERLEAMDRSLQMKEARFKQQFDSMEIMLASLNSTQKWLGSQFDSMMKAGKS